MYDVTGGGGSRKNLNEICIHQKKKSEKHLNNNRAAGVAVGTRRAPIVRCLHTLYVIRKLYYYYGTSVDVYYYYY